MSNAGGSTNRHLEVLGTQRSSEPGQEICRVELRVPEDLFYFSGHFEGDPVLPGVVQLDGAVLAQVERLWPDLGRLERMRRLKFIRIIRPGEVIGVKLTRKSTANQVTFLIESEGESCTSGILSFAAAGS